MAGILGTLVSFIMAPLFVSDHKKEDWNPEFKSVAYSQINKYIFIQNILLSLLGVLTMVLIRNKPETPPNEGEL